MSLCTRSFFQVLFHIDFTIVFFFFFCLHHVITLVCPSAGFVSLIHSVTHSLSLTHLLTHSFTNMVSLIHLFTHSLFTRMVLFPFTFIQPYSLIHSLYITFSYTHSYSRGGAGDALQHTHVIPHLPYPHPRPQSWLYLCCPTPLATPCPTHAPSSKTPLTTATRPPTPIA